MKVLLMSMPDAVSAFDNLVSFPNIGLCSIAGFLREHETRIFDLINCRKNIKKTVLRELAGFRPDFVGLSAMTFQFGSAVEVARIIRDWNREVPIVLGGYHVSLNYNEIGDSPESDLFDYFIRGEGEIVFAALLRLIEREDPDFSAISGLSFKRGGVFTHNPLGSPINLRHLPLPNRGARKLKRFSFFGLQFDCVETSRGCLMSCQFCCIKEMYGRQFRKFPMKRVIEDIKGLKREGTKGVFFVDDNITQDIQWLRELCEAIIKNELTTMHYIIQASVNGIHSDLTLPALLRQAGFKLVFLGIESASQQTLDRLKKRHSASKSIEVVSELHAQGIVTVGGFIVGNPYDRPSDIKQTFRFAGQIGLDHVILQCLTPYPKTEIREILLNNNLITNQDHFDRYNGFIANVRTRHMSSKQLAREMVQAGVKYYNNPKYIFRSFLWRYVNLKTILGFFRVNLRFILSGWYNRMFASTHRF